MNDAALNDPPDAIERAGLSLAERAKAIRKAKGLTIQRVAERCGLAISTISKIERNRMTPTYDCFTKLAHGLDVAVSELLDSPERRLREGEIAVSRRGEYESCVKAGSIFEVLFGSVADKRMVPMFATLGASGENGLEGRTGEEFVLVLGGTVVVDFAGAESVTLETGDSLYLDGQRPHVYGAANDRPARILCVWSGASEARAAVDAADGDPCEIEPADDTDEGTPAKTPAKAGAWRA